MGSRLGWNAPPVRVGLAHMGLRRPIVRRPGSTRPSGLNIVPSWICWKLRMAPIVFGPIRPSTASAGAVPPQEGGTRFSISWMVLMSLLRLAPPSPTEAEIVRGMETSPSAHRIHLRGQLQHRVEAHLLVFRAEVEQAVDVEPQRAFVGSLLLQGHAHSRQSLLVQRDRALQRAPDAVAVVRAQQAARRIVGTSIGPQRPVLYPQQIRQSRLLGKGVSDSV